MKRILPILIFVISLFGCNVDNYQEPTPKKDFDLAISKKNLKTSYLPEVPVPDKFCNPNVVFDLDGESGITRGIVSVNNDENYVYVTIKASENWYLYRTGLYVGGIEAIPLDLNGEPDPYQFDVVTQAYAGISVQTYAVPLANIGPCPIVSIIAKVIQLDANGNMTNNEIAWTKDVLFSTIFNYDTWGGGFGEYCLQDCKTDCYNEETAWSFGTSFNSLTKTKRWGWYSVYTLGQANSYPIYAGKTNDIGSLNVSDDGVNLIVEYQTESGVVMGLAHLYVGTEADFANYMNKKGTPIPGHFPYVGKSDPYTNKFSFTIPLENIESKNGQIIIAAHAESYLPCK